MTLTFEIPNIFNEPVFWFVFYIIFSYFVTGFYIRYHKEYYNQWTVKNTDPPAVLVWVLSPLFVPSYILYKIIRNFYWICTGM